ncbi:hypothetical protein HDV02_004651 [Globomyces sp. JEL0801]|nr:hypothetical protein HDV02_004651 [Globomyces sp. JEL0801]
MNRETQYMFNNYTELGEADDSSDDEFHEEDRREIFLQELSLTNKQWEEIGRDLHVYYYFIHVFRDQSFQLAMFRQRKLSQDQPTASELGLKIVGTNTEPLSAIAVDFISTCVGLIKSSEFKFLPIDTLFFLASLLRISNSAAFFIGRCIVAPLCSKTLDIYKQLGLTNGILGRLEAVLGNSNGKVLALKVYVPPISQSQSFHIPGLEPNTIILKRLTAAETYKLSNGKKFTLRRMQFPITEAFSITDYKSQGQTYQSAILNLPDGKGVSSYSNIPFKL